MPSAAATRSALHILLQGGHRQAAQHRHDAATDGRLLAAVARLTTAIARLTTAVARLTTAIARLTTAIARLATAGQTVGQLRENLIARA